MRYIKLVIVVLFSAMTLMSKGQTNSDLKIKIFCTNWGMNESWDSFCTKVKRAGFDGVETWLPSSQEERAEMTAALQKNKLSLGLLSGGYGSSYEDCYNSFVANLNQAVLFNPDYINCHTGKDYYTFEQNRKLIEKANLISEE